MDLPTKIDFAKVNCRPQLDRANAADPDVPWAPRPTTGEASGGRLCWHYH